MFTKFRQVANGQNGEIHRGEWLIKSIKLVNGETHRGQHKDS